MKNAIYFLNLICNRILSIKKKISPDVFTGEFFPKFKLKNSRFSQILNYSGQIIFYAFFELILILIPKTKK